MRYLLMAFLCLCACSSQSTQPDVEDASILLSNGGDPDGVGIDYVMVEGVVVGPETMLPDTTSVVVVWEDARREPTTWGRIKDRYRNGG